MSETALATAAAGLLLLGATHQVLLAAGAPWARAAYGGRAVLSDGRLPRRLRMASATAAAVLLGVLVWVLIAGGVLPEGDLPPTVTGAGLWVLAVLFALNTAGNLSAPHPVERWGAGALTAVLTVLMLLLACS